MARAAVQWSVRDLAEKSGVHRNTVTRVEAGGSAHGPTLEALRRAFEKAGVEFTNGDEPGVKLRKSAKGVKEISQEIDALEDKISSMPAPTEPSPEAGMNVMRKAVAKNNLKKLKNRRTRITRAKGKRK